MPNYKISELHIIVVRGDDIDINIALLDSVGANVPSSTFTSAKCQVRKSRNEDPIYTFDTSDNSIVITDGNLQLVQGNQGEGPGIYSADIEFVLSATSQRVTPIKIRWEVLDDATL